MSTTARNSASAAPQSGSSPAAKKAAKKTTAKPAQRPAASGPANKVPASRGGRSTGAAAKERAAEGAAPRSQGAVRTSAGIVPVRTGEAPWTAEEVAEVEADLRAEVERLRADVATAEEALADLLRDASDGAGDDQADAGSKNFEREHEMSIANNAREMLLQSERALNRIAAGTYGVCESCGEPIGKARLQVFPRATLCMSCKQKQERR